MKRVDWEQLRQLPFGTINRVQMNCFKHGLQQGGNRRLPCLRTAIRYWVMPAVWGTRQTRQELAVDKSGSIPNETVLYLCISIETSVAGLQVVSNLFEPVLKCER